MTEYVDLTIDHSYSQKRKHVNHICAQTMDSNSQFHQNILEGLRSTQLLNSLSFEYCCIFDTCVRWRRRYTPLRELSVTTNNSHAPGHCRFTTTLTGTRAPGLAAPSACPLAAPLHASA
ncbi:unnamed protein product [Parnassius apollo]|uniref:(apollo) hypothetical protein n=1 Tax=Parnassius apollo TaxID=110799 RepID=A0A8S3X477_PARAO|nr:unnamed protein product [Parnassius apollo]